MFTINSGTTVSISGLTIANGNGSSNGGGGIYSSGTVTISNSTVSNNTGNSGGGIYVNSGALTITNSTLSGNINVGYSGGGIYVNSGTVTISNSTISGSTGAGITSFGTLTVSNSTFSGNTASDGAGIDVRGGTAMVSNSTLSGNTASNGGGIYVSSGSLTLTNSIVAGNTDTGSGNTGDDCYGCTLSGANRISTKANIINPMLGPLAYNGTNQTVQTLLPLPGSPAIEAGLASTLKTDERGLPRPTGSGVVSDLGAVQTNYTSVQFIQQPLGTAVNATLIPAVTVSVTESGVAALNIPVPLTLAGNGPLGGTTTETTTAPSGTAAVATFGNLSVNATGNGDTLNVTLPITPAGAGTSLTLKATSNSFDIFLPTPTITWTTTPPTSVVYGAAPIPLSATLNVTGPTISFVVASGPATISGSTLSFTGAGTVVVQATSTATSSYAAADATAIIHVSPAATTASVAASANSITAGASDTLTASVVSTAGVPTGTVSFWNGSTSIGVAQLNASGVATLTTTTLPVGADTITASFVAQGNFAASTSTNSVKITVSAVVPPTPLATTTTLAALANSITQGASDTLTASVMAGGAPVTSGTVTFAAGGASIGAAQLNAQGQAVLTTTLLPVGSDSITATYVGSASDAASISTNSVSVTVNAATTTPPAPLATTTTLSASANSITQGTSEMLTASVMAGGSPVTSGTVTFAASGASIGAAQLNAQGQAVLTTTLLPVGSDSVTATFVATVSDTTSTSSSVTVTVTTGSSSQSPTLTVQLSAAQLTVQQGSVGQLTLTLTPPSGYVGTVNLACSGLPSETACIFNPTTVTFTSANSGSQTVTLNVVTSGTTAALRPYAPSNMRSNPMPMLATAFWLPGLLAAGAGLRKRCDKGVTSHVGHMLVLLVLLAGVGLMTACGGGSAVGSSATPANSGTPKGAATVTVQLSAAGSLVQTSSFTLNVQ